MTIEVLRLYEYKLRMVALELIFVYSSRKKQSGANRVSQTLQVMAH